MVEVWLGCDCRVVQCGCVMNVVWCGVVWYGVLWCAVMRCAVMGCGVG